MSVKKYQGAEGDLEQELEVTYGYDYAGRRLLRREGMGSPLDRERYFFNGLTEEIVKKAKGTTTDNSFDSVLQLDGQSQSTSGWTYPEYVAFETNTTRRQYAYKLTGNSKHGKAYYDTTDGWDVSGRRAFSTWIKSNNNNAEFSIQIKCTDGFKCGLYYRNTTGSPFISGTQKGFFPLGGTSQAFNGQWIRLERDLQSDLNTLWPGKTLSKIMGTVEWCGNGVTTPTIWFDDLKFSNSVANEHNVLGPGVIAHIMRHREVNATSFAAADEWFHYDQVGNVMAGTGGSAVVQLQDSFGNVLTAWSSLFLSGNSTGRHHNTKEIDVDTRLTYMRARWLVPETGTFISVAPTEAMFESRYGFASANPVSRLDPTGELDYQSTCSSSCPVIAFFGGKKLNFPSKNMVLEAIERLKLPKEEKDCMKERLKNSDAHCDMVYNCTDPNNGGPPPNSYAELGRPGRPGRFIQFCVSTIKKNGLNSKQSLTALTIHELAHNCGMQGEDHQGTAEPPWDSAGLPPVRPH